MTGRRGTIAERFWRHVDQSGDCWIWTASCTDFGYGRLGPDRAHRVSWEIHFGAVPAGMWVLHKCDNPPCVRPDHLFLGTHSDNMRDCVGKRRHRAVTAVETYHTQAMGRPVGVSKFSPAILAAVREMAASGATHRAIAGVTGVSKSLVGYILKPAGAP